MSRIRHLGKLLVLGALLGAPVSSLYAIDYYVDSSVVGPGAGTAASPWKNLSSSETIVYGPGDKLLLRRGGIYNGRIAAYLGTGGSSSAPVIIGSYGLAGDPATPPIINGNGTVTAAVLIKDLEYVTVQDLEITNWPGGISTPWQNNTADKRDGLRVEATKAGPGPGGSFRGIKILRNNIHHVRGFTERDRGVGVPALYDTGALHVISRTTAARFDDLLLEENDLSYNTCIGIMFKSPGYSMTQTGTWSSNVRVRENTFDNMGADLILVQGALSPVIEYNKGYRAGFFGPKGYKAIAGMWVGYQTQDSKFQYNEVGYTANQYTNGLDGDSKAFDVDYGTQGNHVFQYNYTHHNEGGVLIIMPADNNGAGPNFVKTTVYRYNLSVNDGRNTYSCSQFGIHPVPGTSSAHIHNNVFYSTLPEGFKFSDIAASTYSNNIFHLKSGIYPSGPRFVNNCYFGHEADVNDPYKVTIDPKFAAPFPTGAGGDGDVTANTDIFKLQSTSPCINAGAAISIAGVTAAPTDYWNGATVQGPRPDIGAHEHSAGASAPAAPNTVATTVYEEDNVAVSRTSGIVPAANLWCSGNKEQTLASGQWVELSFTGTHISVYGRKGPDKGKLSVLVNGSAAGTVDCYWPAPLYRTELYRITGLSSTGTHIVRLTVNGKNGFSTATTGAIDYFEKLPVAPPALPAVVVIDDQAGVRTGTWNTTTTHAQYYGTTRSVSPALSTTTNTISFTFTGTGVRLYGPRAADRGKMTVTINNANPVVVDQFSPVSSPSYLDFRQKQFEVTNLPLGTYTLKASVAPNEPQVVIDWVEALTASAPAAPVKVDAYNTPANPALVWAGSWTYAADTAFEFSTKAVANFNNASVELTFTGTKARLYVRKASTLGKLNMTVNNGSPTLVDCYSATTVDKFMIFETPTLPYGTHKLKATVSDPTNTYKYVGIDYFEYQP